MREIRFRVWDNSKEKMYYAGEGNSPAHGFLLNFFGDIISNYQKEGTNEYKQVFARIGHSLELMQYSGLKDRNGVEIYEGDLCLHEEQIYEVVFLQGRFALVKPNKPKVLTELFYYDELVEVVGNIFETLELLDIKEKSK